MCYFFPTCMFQSPLIFLLILFIFLFYLLFVYYFFPSNISFNFILGAMSYPPFTLEVDFLMLSEKSHGISAPHLTHTHTYTPAWTCSNPLGAEIAAAPPPVLFFFLSYRILAFFFFISSQLPVQKSMFCYTGWSDSNAGDISPTARCTKNCSSKIPLC